MVITVSQLLSAAALLACLIPARRAIQAWGSDRYFKSIQILSHGNP